MCKVIHKIKILKAKFYLPSAVPNTCAIDSLHVNTNTNDKNNVAEMTLVVIIVLIWSSFLGFKIQIFDKIKIQLLKMKFSKTSSEACKY